MHRITTRKLSKMKHKSVPISMVTAYDFPTAKIVEEAGAHVVLVGDSLGMVVLGYESTIFVTLEDMLHHTKAVSRAVSQSMVIADLPFVTVHLAKDEVLRAGAKLMQEGGAYGIKAEGGVEICDNVKALTQAGIPVMGHTGLTPQSVNQLGGYFIQGKEEKTAHKLIEDARSLESAGIFALVLECVPEEISQMIAQEISVPVIGIGAGRYCDGQVLVLHDLLEIGSLCPPSFVKRYASVGQHIFTGVQKFVHEVSEGLFPTEDHVSHVSSNTWQSLQSKRTDLNRNYSNSI